MNRNAVFFPGKIMHILKALSVWIVFLFTIFSAPASVLYPDSTSGIVSDTNESPDFTSSPLPIISIDTQGKSIVDDPKIEAVMGVIYNGPGMRNAVSDAFNHFYGKIGIETRGESSLTQPKNNYRFETRTATGENLNFPLLGLPAENDWILYGPYIDKSLLRNVLIFHLARQTGRYVSRTVLCELLLNGEYRGVYILMEKIKQDDNRVSIAKLKPGDVSGSELTGGYIIRMDKTDVGTVSFSSGVQWLGRAKVTLQYYEPAGDVITSQQKTYLSGFIKNFENSLVSSGFANPETGYHHYIDVGSFVDFMLSNEMALEVDRYRFSTYLHKEKDTDGDKLHAGPLWDADRGIGNDVHWPYGQLGDVWQYNYGTVTNGRCYWWERLMQDSYFQNVAATRWSMLRKNALSDVSVQQYIDSMVTVLEEPQERNFQVWPVMGVQLYQNTFVGKNYAEEIDYLTSWLRNRLVWMDTHMPGRILTPSARISVSEAAGTSGNFVVRYHLTDDYFNRKKFETKDFKLNSEGEWIVKDTILYLDAGTAELHLKKLKPDAVLPGDFTITASAGILNTSQPVESDRLTGTPEYTQTASRVYTSRNTLLLECDNPELLGEQLELFDTSGRQVHTFILQKSHVNRFETSLATGIYLVKYQVGTEQRIQKMVWKPQ